MRTSREGHGKVGVPRCIAAPTRRGKASTYVISISEMKYDPVGRTYRTYNPHTGTLGSYTETRYDALGRPLRVIPPGGSATANRVPLPETLRPGSG
jgi:hypothetical protein